MFFGARALPARHLITLILGITVVPLATLLWVGWRLLEQDRVLEGQQAEQRVERAADLVVAALQRALSSSEQRLAGDSQQWPEGAVAVIFHTDRVETYPKGRVPYLPIVPPLPEAPDAIFNAGEDLLYRRQDYQAAIDIFRELTESPDPAIQAGALRRLGNTLSVTGKTGEALSAYDRLRTMDSVATGSVPAALFGSDAYCALLEKVQRTTELRTEAKRLVHDLSSGRWGLTYPVYSAYVSVATRWTGAELSGAQQSDLFAGALATLWERWSSLPLSGRESLTVAEQNMAILWLNSGGTFRALLASQEFVDSQWLAAAAPVAREQQISFRLGDSVNDATEPGIKRSGKENALPWNLTVASTAASVQGGDFAARRRWLITGFLLLVAVVLTANYFIIRSVNRELAVARLQSDFVAAVSHEFRTPLTALRQFTDMLRENDPGKERRLICYDAQSRATDRLTKLVESLLDFGRMEAGAHRYSLEQHDCTELVGRVVDDFRGQAQGTACRVEFSGNGSASIQADRDALARAVWNLLDNAVKYSPDNPTIEVQLHRDSGDVRIDVRDHGIGIPAHERPTIFAKFQRGEQARTRGIKGTGIGLAMVEEIVKAHHGRVEVQSEPGKGSTFTIVLPVTG
jgi:two-component system phosphate regulon sensor histidine kinase PhoR